MRMSRILVALVVAAVCFSCNTTAPNATPPPDTATLDSITVGADYSLGYCRVALNAPAPCVEYRGKQASGVAPGCQHANCTTAKQNARANLLTGIPAACGAYIQCNDPCRCIQKAATGEVTDVHR